MDACGIIETSPLAPLLSGEGRCNAAKPFLRLKEEGGPPQRWMRFHVAGLTENSMIDCRFLRSQSCVLSVMDSFAAIPEDNVKNKKQDEPFSPS